MSNGEANIASIQAELAKREKKMTDLVSKLAHLKTKIGNDKTTAPSGRRWTRQNSSASSGEMRPQKEMKDTRTDEQKTRDRRDAEEAAEEKAAKKRDEKQRQEQANKGSKMIWVTFRKEGIHKYPAALDDPKLATGDEYDVSFLGHPHRHIFHFKVAIEVFHDDRDIEFIQFKRWMENMYADGTMKLDYKSCEMISDDLYMAITKRYPGRKIEIDVSEDGENGSHAVYERV